MTRIFSLALIHVFIVTLCIGASLSVVFAQQEDGEDTVLSVPDPGTSGTGLGATSGSGSGGTSGSGSGKTGELTNPLQSKSIQDFLLKIIDVILVFALPIIILYIMYAGYLFVTARGDTGQIETARTALLWAVVGGVIALGAKVIIGVIQGTVAAFQ